MTDAPVLQWIPDMPWWSSTIQFFGDAPGAVTVHVRWVEDDSITTSIVVPPGEEWEGTWYVEFVSLPEGVATFEVWAEDAEGVPSTVQTFEVIIDSLIPETPTLDSPEPGTILTYGEPIVLTGHVRPGATAETWAPNGDFVEAVGDPDGVWTVEIPGDWWFDLDHPETEYSVNLRTRSASGLYSNHPYRSYVFEITGVGEPEEPEEPTQRIILRHATRHILRALSTRVHNALQEAGWFNDPGPLKQPPLKFYNRRITNPERITVEGNLAALTVGDQGTDNQLQLGGGLVSRDIVWYIDVVGTAQAVMVAILDDLRDDLGARRSSPMLTLVDEEDRPIGGWSAELHSVSVQRPDSFESKLHWGTLGGLLQVIMPEDGRYEVPDGP